MALDEPPKKLKPSKVPENSKIMGENNTFNKTFIYIFATAKFRSNNISTFIISFYFWRHNIDFRGDRDAQCTRRVRHPRVMTAD